MKKIKELPEVCEHAKETVLNRITFYICINPGDCERATRLYNTTDSNKVYLCQKAYDPVYFHSNPF